MFRGLSGGWNSLTTAQKFIIGAVGAVIVYGLIAGMGGNGGLGRLTDPAWIMAGLAIVFVALPIHEFAHAAAAVRLGDETPRIAGRYTLNPLAHIDPVGAIMIMVVGFGWAKPVQWNPRNVRMDPKKASIIVSVVGPLSNLALALLSMVVVRLLVVLQPPFADVVGNFLILFAYINVSLFIFNLLPVPPLDGSHVLFALLPGDTWQLQRSLYQYGTLILFAVIFFAPQLISVPVREVMNLMFVLAGLS